MRFALKNWLQNSFWHSARSHVSYLYWHFGLLLKLKLFILGAKWYYLTFDLRFFLSVFIIAFFGHCSICCADKPNKKRLDHIWV